MKKTIKKTLALLLATLMVAMAIPFAMISVAADETAEATPATIKYVKLFAKYSDGDNVHAMYGDVSKITDGDPKPGYTGENDKRSAYTYYQSDDLYESITYYNLNEDGEFVLAAEEGENKTYMGYAKFELDGVSALEDITIWLAGDEEAHWVSPERLWTINDAYDILVSDDGESWTVLKSYAGMCGDDTNAGAGWTAEESAGNIVSVTDANDYDKMGHKIDLDGVEAKYFAIGVKKGMNSITTSGDNEGKVRNAIVFGEVTINGTVVTPDPVKKAPADIYAEAEDGDLLYEVNFNDMTWSDDYYNSDNWNTYYNVSEDGTTVRHLIHKGSAFGATNRRAMWGGIADEERFSLNDGNKYTITFDALFGKDAYNVYGIGIQVDGDNTLVIDGFGLSYWYAWNTRKVNKSDDGAYKWNYYTDKDKTEKQSFAVEVDSENETMTLYVADSAGEYFKVREMTYDGADIAGALVCRIYTTRVNADKTLDSKCWSEISDLTIYKGLVAETLEPPTEPETPDDDNTDDNGGTTPPAGDDNTGDNGGTTPPAGDDNTGNNGGTTPPAGDDNTGDNSGTTPPTGDDNTGNNGGTTPPADDDSAGNEDPETNAPDTSAPETAAPETEPAAKTGCGASVAMSGVALVGACAAVLAIKRRKNED